MNSTLLIINKIINNMHIIIFYFTLTECPDDLDGCHSDSRGYASLMRLTSDSDTDYSRTKNFESLLMASRVSTQLKVNAREYSGSDWLVANADDNPLSQKLWLRWFNSESKLNIIYLNDLYIYNNNCNFIYRNIYLFTQYNYKIYNIIL